MGLMVTVLLCDNQIWQQGETAVKLFVSATYDPSNGWLGANLALARKVDVCVRMAGSH